MYFNFNQPLDIKEIAINYIKSLELGNCDNAVISISKDDWNDAFDRYINSK